MAHWTEQNKALARQWLEALPSIRAYVFSLVPNSSIADEVIQAVALTVVEKYEEYDQSRPFVNWALGITRYTILNTRRTRARDRHVFSDRANEVIEQAAVAVGAEFDRRAAALQNCLGQLAPDARDLIRRRYEFNGSVQKIADQLNRRANSVSMALTRIRRFLRNCIDRRLTEERA